MTMSPILGKNPYISIIIPALNEGGSLKELIQRIGNTLDREELSYEIIVVDDRSTDNTAKIAHELASAYSVRYFLKKGVQGKAESINEGLEYAKGAILSFIDGDLQYPPEKILDMLMCIERGSDVVIGDRVEKEVSIFRKIPSIVFKFIFIELLHGFKFDVQSGLKVFKKECLDGVTLSSTGWAFDLEFLLRVREKGAKISGIPIVFSEREKGTSKISLITASYEIGKNAIQMKLLGRIPQEIAPEDSSSAIGAGFLHNGKKLVSHTLLPVSRSAIITFTLRQKIFAGVFLFILIISIFISPVNTAIGVLAVLSALYFIDTFFSLYLVYKSLRHNPEMSFSDEQINAIDDNELPIYTILCPLYKESEVLPTFLKAIDALDYPKSKLDVLLLLEEDDRETVTVAENFDLPSYVRILVVPDAQPKTKPKACNYGLSFARGDITVIYDAEDIPETTQLKKAYLAFLNTPDNVVCLQAKLNYFNSKQNLLTRLFTAEYSLWFDVMLPGLQSLNTYIPLGGTSNHFKTDVLKELHGWDPFNVTEDCDLGVRLFSNNYRTAVIDSITLEEANSRTGNWIRQRSRWIKGYMQTYLVYMRHPIKFFKENGIHAVLFQLVVGSKIIFGLINPFLWGTTILYFSARSVVGPAIEEVYPPAIFVLAVFSGIFGNFLFFYYYMIGCVKRGHWGLTKYVYLMPLYWFLTSIAAYLAFYQLIVKPHYWEKTTHGLHLKKRTLSFPIERLKGVFLTIGAYASYINPMRLPKYAFALVGVASKKILTTDIAMVEAVGILNNPPIEARDPFIERIYGVLKGIEKYLPQSMSAKTMMRSGILVSGMMVANVMNLLFNTYLGRALSFELFGLVTFVNTIWLLLTIFYNPVLQTVDHVTSKAIAEGRSGRASLFLFRMLRKSVKTAFLISIVWVLAIPFVSDFFTVTDVWALISFTPLIMLGIVDAVSRGYVRGSLKFHVLAMLMILEAGVKFMTGFSLVALGYGEFAYLAIPAGVMVSAFLALWLLRTENGITTQTVLTVFPKTFYSASLLAGASALLFLSVDILFAKHYLSPAAAGEYALLSLVGKMMFFLASFPTSFMITFVGRELGYKNNPKKVFKILFSATAGIAVIGFLVLSTLGSTLIPFIFGEKALTIVSYIPIYVFGIGLFILTNSIVTYHLANKNYIFSLISISLSGLVSLGIIFNHNSIDEIVAVIVATSIFGFLITGFYHLFGERIEQVLTAKRPLFTIPNKIFTTALPYNEKKRILIFNWRDTKHIYAGGAELYVHEMARRWVEKGYEVTQFCGNDGDSKRYEVVDGVQIVRRGGFYLVYLWAPIYYLFVFKKRFDFVIDCENGIPFFTPLYRRGKTFCLLHHVHQEVFTKSLSKPLAFIARSLERVFMPLIYRNKQFITISASSKKAMQALGIGKKGITVIHPGVDLELLHPGQKSRSPIIAYVGRLKDYKSVDVLIKAFHEILKKVPDVQLFIAGSGEEEDYLKKLTSSLRISDSVEFLGKISDAAKATLLQNAWVSVNPSYMEGWGITTIEANACGTPVVASNVSGLKDSVKNPHTGYLVEYGNVGEFSNKILEILTDDNLRKRMEKDSILWAEYFNWDITSEKFLETIDASKKYA